MNAVLHPLPRVVVLGLLLLGLVGSRDGRSQERSSEPELELVPASYALAGAEASLERADFASESVSREEGERPMRSAVGGDPRSGPVAPDGSVSLYRICRVTAYCDRGRTAAGVPSGVGQCAAPAYVPLGSLVRIPELNRSFLVTDRTHKRFRNSTVDLFIPSERECKQFGRKFLEVEIIVPPAAERARSLGYR